jgi:hypothetical protein
MSHKYVCNVCNYFTSRLNDITKHNLTKAHKIKCNLIENDITNKNVTNVSEMEKMRLEIANLKKELIAKDDMLTIKDALIKTMTEHKTDLKDAMANLKEDKQMFKTMISSKTTQSVSSINFLTAHRDTAPPLECLTEKTAKLFIKYKNNDFISFCISHQRENSLHIFIGDIIVDSYRKKDPKDQSIWNSDVSRLTFIIRDKVKDVSILPKGKKETKYINKWVQDKKGVIVNERIVIPILQVLRDTLDKYIKVHSNEIIAMIEEDPFGYGEEMVKIGYAGKIITNIASGKLANRISTHIGSQFQMNNRNVLQNVTSESSSDEDDNSDSDSDSSNDSDSSDDSDMEEKVVKKVTKKK